MISVGEVVKPHVGCRFEVLDEGETEWIALEPDEAGEVTIPRNVRMVRLVGTKVGVPCEYALGWDVISGEV